MLKIAALRVFNALLYAAAIAMLRGLGVPRRILVAVALNPANDVPVLTNVHNDIIAIDLLLGAAALARTRNAAASGLFAAAGLVKLPYLALGLPVFSAARPISHRLIAVAAGIAAAAAVSWFAGGSGYVAALTQHASPAHVALAWRLIPAGIALVALVAALLGARRYIAALWFIPSLGAFELPWATASGQTFAMPWILPWYFIWGLPYALNRHRILGFLTVSFPLLGRHRSAGSAAPARPLGARARGRRGVREQMVPAGAYGIVGILNPRRSESRAACAVRQRMRPAKKWGDCTRAYTI